MGCCISKDDVEEDRIYFSNEKYGEEDIRELGVCEICKATNILVSFYLDDGCICVSCEAITRGGMKEVYHNKRIDRLLRYYGIKKNKKALYEVDLN
tara:strand:- start:42 stop:329 length:288 start_codon:yes stop_codon:yes gene_type:complete